ncbi:2OG-Fe dioxygenase family protein [Xenorhabdus bovienii]|uniref:2OG-Fe dioxygenase family protein n=1 Tax=Xenorhabdus bovienii str. kraussei Becker Underwood TaxID=1398204 RepID=A0A077PVS9_XENBV|nr:2OG-Fe dioxygenase family protein [Xenorhabdus bovienii]CDH23969.1 conserved hypothetical protein [Xenorhabdus bovienii str. kraussei Becker Underwood]
MANFNVNVFLADVKSTYIKEKFVSLDGDDVVKVVRELGATDEDLDNLKTVSNNLFPDPTLPFRESRNGRFELDFANSKLNRIEFQPFVLSVGEDFVRHDSGMVRSFRGIGDDLQLNRAFQALLLLKAFIIKGVKMKERPSLNYSSDSLVSTVFNLRTITTPDLIGEPALEGVHADGVDHTMTTMLGKENLTDDSAITFIHDMREKNGTRWNEVNPNYRLGQAQHKKFLDTLLIVDHEIKHSLSPVHSMKKDIRSTRDMLIFFTRHPAVEGHVSHSYDSFNLHKEIPLSIDYPNFIAAS